MTWRSHDVRDFTERTSHSFSWSYVRNYFCASLVICMSGERPFSLSLCQPTKPKVFANVSILCPCQVFPANQLWSLFAQWPRINQFISPPASLGEVGVKPGLLFSLQSTEGAADIPQEHAAPFQFPQLNGARFLSSSQLSGCSYIRRNLFFAPFLGILTLHLQDLQ